MEKEVVLAIDLSGTYTKLGLVTKTGSIVNVNSLIRMQNYRSTIF